MRLRYSMTIVGLCLAAGPACGGDDTADGSGLPSGAGGAGQGGGSAGSGSGGEAAAGGAGGAGSASGGNGTGGGPGGVSVACQECATANCLALSDACSLDVVCRTCILVDYSDPSCDANANWTALGMCLCGADGTGPCAADCPCE